MEAFELNFELVAGLSPAAVNHFWDEFIEQAIESQDLVFGGGGGERISSVVSSGANDNITMEHRVRIFDWLRSRKEVSFFTAS